MRRAYTNWRSVLLTVVVLGSVAAVVGKPNLFAVIGVVYLVLLVAAVWGLVRLLR